MRKSRLMVHVLALLVGLASASQRWSASSDLAATEQLCQVLSSDPRGNFEFMVGEWDITLLRSNAEGAFEESPGGTASTYSILGGKAILELSRTGPAPRLAIRHHDSSKQRWVQWVARPDRTGVRLEPSDGCFRHGRCEMRRTIHHADGRTVVLSQTFSDITQDSFRWDEATSRDLGKSWEYDWVMEFNRGRAEPKYPVWLNPPPLDEGPTRCDEERFRLFEVLVGKWRGEGHHLDVASVLERCAVLGMLEVAGGGRELLFLTWDAVEQKWLMGVLDDGPGSELRVYSGSGANQWFDLVHEDGEPAGWTVWGQSHRLAGAQLSYHRGERYLRFERVEDQKR